MQCLLFLDKEENKKIIELSKKWNLSKEKTIKRIIKNHKPLK